VLLRCNYEEMTALAHGARAFLARDEGEEGGAVAAPPRSRAAVEALLPRLEGDMAVETLAVQRVIETALKAIVEYLHDEMDTAVVATHAADEGAVAAYFDYAHALTVLSRAREMGREMSGVIELVTGAQPTPEVALTFQFPD
jgi:hypothetical protein